MAINTTYSHPVTVNGYSCRDCGDVALAKRNVDPAHPQSGPDNRTAGTDPSRAITDPVRIEAARRVAESRQNAVTGYCPNGNCARAPTDSGSLFSLLA